MKRTPTILLSLLAVVTLALSGAAIVQSRQQIPNAGALVGEVTKPRPVAVFIGDSYTEGAGGAKPVWPVIVSQAKGWRMVNLGNGGTGFTTRGAQDRPTYVEMVPAAIEAAPAVVIVSTAGNDGRADVTDAAMRVFRELRAALPDARIVAVAPFRRGPELPRATMADEVRRAAAAAGVEWVDPDDPLVGHPELLLEDGVHPTSEGHAALAAAVLDALG